jgi:hypothetical protein
MWPALLDHISAACAAQTQAGHGADHMRRCLPDDDVDDDFDEDDFDEDDDDREGEDDEDDDADVETWQVSTVLRNSRSFA